MQLTRASSSTGQPRHNHQNGRWRIDGNEVRLLVHVVEEPPMRAAFSLLFFLLLASAHTEHLTAGESSGVALIEAAFRLDVTAVSSILKEHGDAVNADIGVYDQSRFNDPWDLCYSPIGSEKWTALMAACSSNRYPNPGKAIEN